MDRYKETFNTWNKVASLYRETFFDLDLYNDTYDTFCEQVTKKNARILDLGCGPGSITHYLLTKEPGLKITGIEVAPKMIELARKLNPTADFRVMDIRNLQDLDEKFNGIIAGFCVPYLSAEDLRQLWKSCAKILADPGIFYFSFVEGDPEGFRISNRR